MLLSASKKNSSSDDSILATWKKKKILTCISQNLRSEDAHSPRCEINISWRFVTDWQTQWLTGPGLERHAPVKIQNFGQMTISCFFSFSSPILTFEDDILWSTETFYKWWKRKYDLNVVNIFSGIWKVEKLLGIV